MQCTGYLPEYYYPRDHSAAPSGSSWSISHNDITWNSSRGFNISLPQFMLNQNQDLVHQKEILRQMILRHESTFRYQVMELHRVYGRQRELMDEIKRRKLVEDHLHFQAESNTFMSQLRSEISGKSYWPIVNLTSIEPYAPSKEMFQESSNSTGKTVQQGGDYFSGRNVSKECNLSSSKSNVSRKRMLDLEVPAEEYIDNEDGEPFEEENPVKKPNIMIAELQPQCYSKVNFGDSSISLSSCRGTSLLFDLNEPVQPVESEWQNSAFESENIHEEIRENTCEHIAAVKDNKVSNCTSSGKGMDLNLTPPNHLSEYQSASTSNISRLNFPEGRNVEIHKNSEVLDISVVPDSTTESRKCTRDNHLIAARIDSKLSTTNICIDLNSCIKEEFLSSSPSEATMPTAERDMEVEGPVSPENKECSPPRGDSQDIMIGTSLHLSKGGHSDLVEELDKVAADILIFISSSAVQGYSKTAISESSEASNNYLGWLAEVAAALARFPENEVEQRMEVHFERDISLSDRNDCSRTVKLNLRESVPAVDSLLHQANEKDISPKTCTWRKTPSRMSSRARRRSNDGKRTMCSLLQHTLDTKHGITDRFLKGWGLTKRRQRARRAQSYIWSSFSFLADE
ncbi:uncharacterized protein [Nicotiana tomentosiformis]|uniref:uncharacterized protein n=1 Tax=Nicotiana tomentosiformis TaxID=4098 RepID=UPI00051B8711|nr:uncharacterized protein LOC104117013 [Nicotiana tomentosiformis]XP_009626285.1 uncharacterized protein LOC104117013 [Nicotiana tomentosiformis]